jgi:hypothetical protein
MAVNDTYLERQIMTAAARGAWIGTISVALMVLAAIVLTGSSMHLMAIAALAAGFGGSAFGAMLGVSAAAARVPIPPPIRTTTAHHDS